MSNHFKEYFICPHCGKPRVSKEEFIKYISTHGKGCRNCGKNMAAALAEATAEITNDQEPR